MADECWSINYDDYGSDPVCGTSDESELVTPLAHAEQERIFFLHFESEKLKVDTFYKKMEEEYGLMALDLEKQLLAFFELQDDYAQQTLKIRNIPRMKDQDSSISSDSGESSRFFDIYYMSMNLLIHHVRKWHTMLIWSMITGKEPNYKGRFPSPTSHSC